MAVSICIASPFRKFTGGLGKVEAEARDVKELINLLESQFPGLRASILDKEGNILPHLNIYLNELDIEALNGLATALHPGDEVAIVPAIAGGEGESVEAKAIPSYPEISCSQLRKASLGWIIPGGREKRIEEQ